MRFVLFLLVLLAEVSCADEVAEIHADLLFYCDNEAKLFCVATPYDCDLCTNSAHAYLVDKANNIEDICYTILTKRDKEAGIKVGDLELVPIQYFNASLFDKIISNTSQQKFPVVLDCTGGRCKLIEF